MQRPIYRLKTLQHPGWLILSTSVVIAIIVALFEPLYALLLFLSFGLLLLFWFNPFALFLLVVALSSIISLLEDYRVFADTPYAISVEGIVNVGIILLIVPYFTLFKRGRFRVNKRIVVPYVLYLIWGFLSLTISADRNWGLRLWIAIANPFAFYLMLSNAVKTKVQTRYVISAVLFATLVPLVIGLYQAVFSSGQIYVVLERTYNRIRATFSHPANYGMFLIFTTAMLFPLYLEAKSRTVKVLLGMLIALFIISAVFTYIRIVWIALFVMLSVILYNRSRHLLILVFVAIIILVATVPSLQYRVASLITEESQPTLSQDPSTRFRVMAWQLAADLFREHPFSGVGIGSYFDAIERVYGEKTSPHNEYLRVLSELGIIGLLLFIWTLWELFSFSRTAYRSLHDPLFKSLALGAWAASVAFILLCVTDNPLVYHSVGIYFWTLLALVEVGWRNEIKQYPRLSVASVVVSHNTNQNQSK